MSARTFGFVKPDLVGFAEMKKRLREVWPDLQDGDFCEDHAILKGLLQEDRSSSFDYYASLAENKACPKRVNECDLTPASSINAQSGTCQVSRKIKKYRTQRTKPINAI